MTYTIEDFEFYDLAGYTAELKYFALTFEASPAKYQRTTYRPVGIDGTYTLSGGRMERPINCTARFIEADAVALATLVSAFRDTIEDTPLIITGTDLVIYNRCFLQTMKTTREPRHCSVGVFKDIDMSFVQYGGDGAE